VQGIYADEFNLNDSEESYDQINEDSAGNDLAGHSVHQYH
jgi:hypothetical protein